MIRPALAAILALLPALSCSPVRTRPTVPDDAAPPPVTPARDAAAPPRPDAANPISVPDSAVASAPDTAAAVTPDAAATLAPDTLPASAADADPVARDGAPAPADAGRDDGARPVSDAGGVSGATWMLTGCNQAMLMYPNIDKNMGRFPPGSCPPPESLKAVCPGDSKIKVAMATAS